jgi:hypothetical protein
MDRKINWLQRYLPDGLIVDAGWLSRHGYSPQLRRHYLASGWLEQPAPHIYQRPPSGLSFKSIDWLLGRTDSPQIKNEPPQFEGGTKARRA